MLLFSLGSDYPKHPHRAFTMSHHPNYLLHIDRPNYDPDTGIVKEDNGYESVCDPTLGITCRMKIGFRRTKDIYSTIAHEFYNPTYSLIHDVVYCCIKYRATDKEYIGTVLTEFELTSVKLVEFRAEALKKAYDNYLEDSVIQTMENKDG